jgi:hypothetical protein
VGLILLSTAAWTISVQTLRHSLTEEFTSKGAAIANSLASSSVDLILTRDAERSRSLPPRFASAPRPSSGIDASPPRALRLLPEYYD